MYWKKSFLFEKVVFLNNNLRKMKNLGLLFIIVLVVFSCKKKNKNDDPVVVTPEPIAENGAGVYDIDSNFYHTTFIYNCGEWTSENLKVCHYNNGDTIFSGRNLDDISGAGQPSYFFYTSGDSVGSMKKYGRLYTEYVVEDWRGLCPAGWHIPTKAEWDTLQKYLGGQEIAGGKLKGSSYWTGANSGADNSSLFNALPAGFREAKKVYPDVTTTAIFWTSTQDTANRTWSYYVKSDYPTLFKAPKDKNMSFSVRCKRF